LLTGKKEEDEMGCCGFMMNVVLRTLTTETPFLEVLEFRLPITSKHLLISDKAFKSSKNKVIVNEHLLSPTKTNLVKTMGKHRVKLRTVRNLLADQFEGLKLDKQLLHRVMKKGCDDVWGFDDNESITIFYAQGLNLREFDTKFGVNGKFKTTSCSTSGALVSWLEQLPLEVLNTRIYGKDAVWVEIPPTIQQRTSLKLPHHPA